MTRSQSRWQIRQSAARAFALRNRRNPTAVREPELGETPLSPEEVCFGLQRGLIDAHVPPLAPARAFAERA